MHILRILFLLTLFLFGAGIAYAYEIEVLPNTSEVGDFVVGPGKTEVELSPGGSAVVNIIVTNRTGGERVFDLVVEDFTGSRNINETVKFLGSNRGPYSLKDFLSFDESTFVLQHGERATIPVTISIPFDEAPGGRYGSVLVTNTTKPSPNLQNTAGRSPIIARIGTLFFVRIPGDVVEDGELVEFTTANNQKYFTDDEPIVFRLLYENNGSVYLNPYGEIVVTNMFGNEIGRVEVDPWFALPDSLRLREVTWNKKFTAGRYTATAFINRGYDDIIDEISTTYWVIPWKYALGIFIVLVFLIWIIRFIGSRFEFRRKTSPPSQHTM